MGSQEDYTTQLESGEVVNLWSYGVPNDNANDFKSIPFSSSIQDYKHYMHCAHGMLYSLSDQVVWRKFKKYANILMQMRNDGNLGFGGGLLDGKEEMMDCLNRELKEEFGMKENLCKFQESDHIMSSVNDKKKMVCHFYAKEVDNGVYEEIEKGVIAAKDWGTETMGIMRVPLFILDDGMRGFPVFLANQFAGFAKEQLLETLKQRHIIPAEHMEMAWNGYRRYVDCLK